MGKTRKELEQIIRSGGSTIHNGVYYARIEDLPSEAELAKGDKAREDAARQSIKAEIKRLEAELEILDDSKAHASSTAKKAEPKAEESSKPAEKEVKPAEGHAKQ